MQHDHSRMKDGSILKLLLKFALPATAGLVANALYNIVDRVFIGHVVGPEGLAGVTVAFPFVNFLAAFAMLVGVGGSYLVAFSLGEDNKARAQASLDNIVMLVATGIVFCMALGWLFLDQILYASGASPTILPLGREYLGIIVAGIPFSLSAFVCNYLIRAEGKPNRAMGVLLIGAGCNILLDLLLVVVIPLGLKGAALATVLSQMAASAWGVGFYLSGRSSLNIRPRSVSPDWVLLRRIGAVGAAPFIMKFTFTALWALFTWRSQELGGDLAVSATGIFLSLDAMLYLTPVGIGEGMQPIISYNLGAKQYGRVIDAIKVGFIAATVVCLVSFGVVMLFPKALVYMFNADNQELIRLAVRSLMLGYLCLPLVGGIVVTSFALPALGKVMENHILNFGRQIVFFLPFILVLPNYLGLDGVWLTLSICDLGGFLMAAILALREIIRLRALHREQNFGLRTVKGGA